LDQKFVLKILLTYSKISMQTKISFAILAKAYINNKILKKMLRILSIFTRLHKVIRILYDTGVIDILSKGSSC